MLWAISVGYGQFHFVLGDSIWLWAILFGYGRFHFVLGDSILLWAIPFLFWAIPLALPGGRGYISVGEVQ
jgi:hypothetical protein